MRRTTSLLLAADLTLIALATLTAFLLRDGIEGASGWWEARLYYLGWTVVIACLVFCAAGVNRSFYRFASFNDYLWLSSLTVLAVVGAMGMSFLVNRLEGVSRSLPILQTIFAISALIVARVVYRLYHARLAANYVGSDEVLQVEDVLVLGLNPVTELFVRSIDSLCRGRIRVHGILTPTGLCLKGRRIGARPVLGELAHLEAILAQLKVHGVDVTRLVVTEAEKDLGDADRARLKPFGDPTGPTIDFFADRLGFAEPRRLSPAAASLAGQKKNDLEAVDPRRYRVGKRLFDVTLATVLLVLLWPLIVVVAVVVWADVGRPLLFWQQRPGQGGRPIRVFKFRTMKGAYDDQGRGLADAHRLSAVGAVLRERRLDELPQLFNILVGDMSFVGPRPLLPIDQPSDRRDRLRAKPGLTGWAQVMGGRTITAADKAALDRWYAENMSFALDIEIMLRTVPMIVLGERVNVDAIRIACDAIGRAPDHWEASVVPGKALGGVRSSG